MSRVLRASSHGVAPGALSRYAATAGALVVAALAALTLLAACSDRPTAPRQPPDVSALVALSAPISLAGGGVVDVVYVSLPPGSVPGGESATLRNQTTGQSRTAPVVQGGFDPVKLSATVGDELTLEIHGTTGVIARATLKVGRRTALTVVRTDPPKGKTDVPVNGQILVVFSEPVTPATVPGAIQLFRGSERVSGTAVLAPSGLAAEFRPDALLAPNTAYELVVTTGAQTVGGDALEAAVDIPFTTGARVIPVATVEVQPPSATLLVGQRLQLTATTKDASGAVLSGSAITWASSNPGLASVSSTGLVTALGLGSALVSATSEGQTAWANLMVLPPSFPSGTFTPVGNMNAARANHGATLLPDGRVLIFGGLPEGVVGPQAEVYDPSRRTFSPADEMITSRGGHPAVVLPGGKLLFLAVLPSFAGNPIVLQDGRTFFAEPIFAAYATFAEIYDPASGTFTRAGDYAHAPPVDWTMGTLLRDGRVLLTGYQMPDGVAASAATELFDPASGTFSRTGPMDDWSNTAGWGTLLTDGTVLFVQWNFNADPDPVDIYDPATSTFSRIGSLGADLPYSQAVRLQDGTVLITGGRVPGLDGIVNALRYLPATRTFAPAGTMTTGRNLHTATLLPDGTVLIAGGFTSYPASTASAEIYRP